MSEQIFFHKQLKNWVNKAILGQDYRFFLASHAHYK